MFHDHKWLETDLDMADIYMIDDMIQPFSYGADVVGKMITTARLICQSIEYFYDSSRGLFGLQCMCFMLWAVRHTMKVETVG